MDHAAPGRLWVRLMKRHRVERDAIAPCTRDDPEAALRELLPRLDLSQPMWLPRHRADWEQPWPVFCGAFRRSRPLRLYGTQLHFSETRKSLPCARTPAGEV